MSHVLLVSSSFAAEISKSLYPPLIAFLVISLSLEVACSFNFCNIGIEGIRKSSAFSVTGITAEEFFGVLDRISSNRSEACNATLGTVLSDHDESY